MALTEREELELLELEKEKSLASQQSLPQQSQQILPSQITQNPDVQLMASWLRNIPFGQRVSSVVSRQPLENIQRTLSAIPEPQSKTLGMAIGKALPDIAMATPFMRGAGLLGKIPKIGRFIPSIAKTTTGLGAYSGIKAKAQNQPVLPATLQGMGSGALFHGAGKIGASLIPPIIPGAERIGSALGGYATGKLLNPQEDKEAMFYGAIGGIFPSQRFQGSPIAQKTAEQIIKYALKPKKSLYEFKKSPERAITQEGIMGKDFDTIDKKAEVRLNQLNQYKDRLKFEAKNMGITVDLAKNQVFKPISKLLTEFQKMPESHASDIKTISNILSDLLMPQGKFRKLNKITIDEAYELRDMVNSLKPSGIFNTQSEAMLSKALHQTYHNIVEAINISGISPNLKQINIRISDLITAREAIQDATNRNPNIFRFIPIGMFGLGLGAKNPFLIGAAIASEAIQKPLVATGISKAISTKYPKIP